MGKSYHVSMDIDDNAVITVLDGDDIIERITEHPKTRKKLNYYDAINLLEYFQNPPSTKSEFFSAFTDLDYEKYYLGKVEIDRDYLAESKSMQGLTQQTKLLKVFISKLDALSDFAFTDDEIETSGVFCKRFSLSFSYKYA